MNICQTRRFSKTAKNLVDKPWLSLDMVEKAMAAKWVSDQWKTELVKLDFNCSQTEIIHGIHAVGA